MKSMSSCDDGEPRDYSQMPLKEAMDLPDPEKLLWFKAARFLHPKIKAVLHQFECMADRGSGTDIIILIGPTGVGKSTLISFLWKGMMKRLQAEMLADPGFIPAVVFDGPASGERVFSWRSLYSRTLEGLQSVLIDRKQLVIERDGRILTRGTSHGSTVAALRFAVERELIARRTTLLAIDEAVPLLRNRRGDTLENTMDALKSLANICGLTLALIGSYDLLQLAKLSGQLARRCSIIDFPRYHRGVEEEDKDFVNAVWNLQNLLPVKDQPNLVKQAPKLMEESLGCVGILKDILSRALAFSLQAGGTWSNDHLRRALLPNEAKKAILREILLGENAMRCSAFGSGKFGQLAEIENSLRKELVGLR